MLLSFTFFQSIDGFEQNLSGGAITDNGFGGVNLNSGTVSAQYAGLTEEVSHSSQEIDFRDRATIQFNARILSGSGTPDYTVYLVAGDLSGNASIASPSCKGFGFKIIDDTLYAVSNFVGTCGSANEILSVISNITVANMNVYRAVFTSGQKIEFYVNEVLRITQNITTNSGQSNHLFELFVRNDGNQARLIVTFMSLIRDL